MHILINVALLPDLYPEEYISFLSQLFRRITKDHPAHRFVFICEERFAPLFAFGNNTEIIKTSSRKATIIGWRYWYAIRIPFLLKKYKAGLFISAGILCVQNSRLPQYLLINDLSFLHFPSLYTKGQLLFLKKRFQQSVNEAKQVITFTELAAREIGAPAKMKKNKVLVIPPGIPEKLPGTTAELQLEIKQKYAGGKEFFLYAGSLPAAFNIINLLKAFSLFKKRQQSSFRLVICIKDVQPDKKFRQLLQTYKYKDEVNWVVNPPPEELSAIISSAYAFVYPVFSAGLPLFVVQAMQAGIPVIASAGSAAQEITAGAALYIDAENPQNIADSMMRIYKDEKGRSELIEKGKKTIGNRYDGKDPASALWEAIRSSVV